jgi:hypothetical protein
MNGSTLFAVVDMDPPDAASCAAAIGVVTSDRAASAARPLRSWASMATG